MTNLQKKQNGELEQPEVSEKAEKALIQGDLSGLSKQERMSYYQETCRSLGLNPLTKPFEYIKLNGELQLYASKGAADQLRSVNDISIEIVDEEARDSGLYIVTVKAQTADGRTDRDKGVVYISPKESGSSKANKIMKALTKAKRRVTLSICGLGLLDESELESIPSDQKEHVDLDTEVEVKEAESSVSEDQDHGKEMITDREGLHKKLEATLNENGIDREQWKRWVAATHDFEADSMNSIPAVYAEKFLDNGQEAIDSVMTWPYKQEDQEQNENENERITEDDFIEIIAKIDAPAHVCLDYLEGQFDEVYDEQYSAVPQRIRKRIKEHPENFEMVVSDWAEEQDKELV